MFGTGGVQATLRIENVLAPGLIEANGDVVAALRQRLQAAFVEDPRFEEAWRPGARDGVELNTLWQRTLIPAAGVDVDIMPVREQAPGQVRDVGLAAPPRRQHAFIAEGDVHSIPSTLIHVHVDPNLCGFRCRL